MRFILLLGAGFSRNWGGWLASEAFEYLLGSPQIDQNSRELLWLHKRCGGFEGALARLQERTAKSGRNTPNRSLVNLQNSIIQMFSDMNEGFSGRSFEFQGHVQYRVGPFLSRFDAIFTLNQDLLLEQHYLPSDVSLLSGGRWNSSQIPGMRPIGGTAPPFGSHFVGKWQPDPDNFRLNKNSQPYFKLHESCNWLDPELGDLLVLGGNKSAAISNHAVLKWSHQQFKMSLE